MIAGTQGRTKRPIFECSNACSLLARDFVMALAIDLEEVAVIVPDKVGTQAEENAAGMTAEDVDIDRKGQVAIIVVLLAAPLKVRDAGRLRHMVAIGGKATLAVLVPAGVLGGGIIWIIQRILIGGLAGGRRLKRPDGSTGLSIRRRRRSGDCAGGGLCVGR